MKSVKMGTTFLALLSAVAVGPPLSATTENNTPIVYFLEQTPNDLMEALSNLPPDAKDVVVAKVRLQEPVIWMGGRHCEFCTNDIWATRLKITEALKGRAEVGQVLDVFLGQRSDHRRYVALPCTPDQRGREYTVTIYSAEDGKRRLASFPISKSQYDGSSVECLAYQRERGKAGFRE
ncbi:hypothetical protein [Bradyrhizobium sp. USDA 3650]